MIAITFTNLTAENVTAFKLSYISAQQKFYLDIINSDPFLRH